MDRSKRTFYSALVQVSSVIWRLAARLKLKLAIACHAAGCSVGIHTLCRPYLVESIRRLDLRRQSRQEVYVALYDAMQTQHRHIPAWAQSMLTRLIQEREQLLREADFIRSRVRGVPRVLVARAE